MTKPLTPEQKERRQMLKARKARELIVECGEYGLTPVIGISSTVQLHDVYGKQGA